MSLRGRWAGLVLGGLLLGVPAMTRAAGPGGAVAANRTGAAGLLLTGQIVAGQSRMFWGQDLFVPDSQRVGRALCVFCSAQIEGDVTGSVVVLFGNLSATGEVGGNVLVVGGNAVFDGAARVRGTTTVIGGNAVYESEQTLPGNVLVLGGHSSSFARREAWRRQLTIGPKLLSTLVLLGALGIMLAFVAARRPRAAN